MADLKGKFVRCSDRCIREFTSVVEDLGDAKSSALTIWIDNSPIMDVPEGKADLILIKMILVSLCTSSNK
jgi:hypothetical protein